VVHRRCRGTERQVQVQCRYRGTDKGAEMLRCRAGADIEVLRLSRGDCADAEVHDVQSRCRNAEMQKSRNAEMQKCRNAEVQ
jgi:hypothetical protein